MPKEIYPSSYLCDCGYQKDIFENKVTKMNWTFEKEKTDSRKAAKNAKMHENRTGREIMDASATVQP